MPTIGPTIWAEAALLPGGWASGVRVTVEGGRIASVAEGARPEGERRALLLPAPANVHLHAFQRAMAGLAERKGTGPDSFWTWRETMFRFLQGVGPEEQEAVAAYVQMELLEAGFAASTEFHYLHRRPDGGLYDDPAEMAARVCAAADATGVGLTLLPSHYVQGGLDGRALGPGQARFGTDRDLFGRLIEGARAALARLPPDADLGLAPHSLRAVPADDLRWVASLGVGPIHLHLAEQEREVEEVRAHTGQRPVEWALDHLGLDAGWCLIHLTRMEPPETLRLAATGAVAGLCPTTEASLGDGVFDAARWLGAGGRFGIGADSAVRVALAEELRQLETTQRLRDGGRAVLATPERSVGRRLFEEACAGGALAAGRAAGAIAPGLWADLLALDAGHPHLEGLGGDAALDAWVMAGDDRLVSDVWSAGRHVVREGRHVAREAIVAGWRRAARRLRAAA